MNRFLNRRLALLATFTFAYVWLVMWAVGAVMRESDQASIITGALDLARGGDFVGRAFYNYDMLFSSYWVLAGFYKLMGLSDVTASADFLRQITWVGNFVAAGCFLLGVTAVVFNIGKNNEELKWWKWMVLIMCLLSPVILFSAPLLSPAIISAGFLLLMGSLLHRKGSLCGDVAVGFFVFMAVGARMDAVLVMPFLACLSAQRPTFGSLIKSRRIWFAGIGCLLAIGVGRFIFPFASHEPTRFFNGLLTAAYMVFGLNGVLWIALLFFAGVLLLAWRKKSVFNAFTAVCFLLPVGYYVTVFFSPRYLILWVVALMLSLVMKRGQEFWTDLMKMKFARIVMVLAAMHSLGALFIGIGMKSKTSGSLVTAQPTLFPTADGYWPMGANLSFYKRLKEAEEFPIDHNQRVWAAWCAVDASKLTSDSIAIKSSGLVSYGGLWLRAYSLSRKSVKLNQNNSHDVIMIDGRSLLSKAVVQNGKVKPAVTIDELGNRDVMELGRAWGDSIFLVNSYQDDEELFEKPQRWSDLQLLSQINGGDDVIIMEPHLSMKSEDSFRADEAVKIMETPGRYSWFFIVNEGEQEGFMKQMQGAAFIKSDALKPVYQDGGKIIYSLVAESNLLSLSRQELSSDVIIARSALPVFMQKKNF